MEPSFAAPERHSAQAKTGRVTDIRFWSFGDAIRIAVQVDSEFEFKSDRLDNPDRLFFDIIGVKPQQGKKGMETIPVNDGFVKQIRVAETHPGTTRIVLDLQGPLEFTTSQLANPDRLMIELRNPDKKGPALIQSTTGDRKVFQLPPRPVSPDIIEGTPKLDAQPVQTGNVRMPAPNLPSPRVTTPPPPIEVARATTSAPSTMKPAASSEVTRFPERTPVESAAASAITPHMPRVSEVEPATPAKRTSTGDRSMTRVLGLKLGKVVIDAGHGGHDAGTEGPTGLMEKDLVLDVAKRLGALIESRLGSEVIYTRSDDTFIPLQERTQIANEHKADLFLSIHANSSPVRTASGVETYYLNFTTSRSALELAARENASSENSIYDLKDLLQKIALKDKVEESREFASRVQNSLSALSVRTNGRYKDRGVRKAPFVVLIGASMPSILAEIGFVSNPHDEGLMKKPEYRQKIAEALYKGVAQYAAGLSHFQVAQKTE